MVVTDHRLKAAREGLAAGTIRVLSVDVFDTLLSRRVPDPKDVFLLLGHCLAAAGHLSAPWTALQFAELRRTAELAAREKKQAVTGYREITLADIYAELPDFLFAPSFATAQRIAAEVVFERELMLLDHGMVALMQAAKAAGARVLLVSDTYFSADDMRGFLAAVGFDISLVDRLYISNEAGKPKWRDLFDVVLKDMAVSPGEMLHVGDTLDADVNPCRQRGITHVHYDKWAFSPRVNGVEFPADKFKRAVLLGARGDLGLTGLRSRIYHRPPAAMAHDLRPYWQYGAAVLSPVYAAFARWIVASCRDAGVTRIYGIMREGRFLGRLVSEVAKRNNVDLTTQEVWLSRRAVVGAALYPDDLGALTEFVLLSPGRSTDEVLAEMDIARADLNGLLPVTFDLRQPDALMALCQAIIATAALRAKVLAVSARHRRNLLAGLAKTFDVSQPGTIMLMDLGYAATIQSVLTRILAREKFPIRLSGLYLALNDRAAANVRGGADAHAYLDHEGFGGPTSMLLSRTPDVLEHATMCREGSLARYDDAGAPVLLPNQRDESQLQQMEAMQEGILAGAAAIDAVLGDFARTPADAPELKHQAAAIISASHLYPTPREAQTIGQWKHEANFDLNDRRKLADMSLDPATFEYGAWPALQGLGRHEVYWPAAALAAADPFIATAFAAGMEGAYRPEHLTSGTVLGGLVISPDLGLGFDAKREAGVPLSINAFGRGQVSGSLKPFGADVIRRLRLRWPKARAVVAIDKAIVSYVGERERRTVEVAVPLPAWSNAKPAAPGIYLTEPAGAETIVVFPEPPSWPHAVELTLRYKYLKLDGLFGSN